MPVVRSQRRIATSTLSGSNSITRATLPVRSAARMVVPLPPNGSRIDAVAPTAVADQIGDEADRLHHPIGIELILASCLQAIYLRVIQDIGPMPAVTASEILDMRAGAVLENGDQLVFRAVKTAPDGLTLVPDQNILPLGIEWPGNVQEFGQ